MKMYNINLFCCFYYFFYLVLFDLIDELGFWVMDEVDFEVYGFYDVIVCFLDIFEEWDYEI